MIYVVLPLLTEALISEQCLRETLKAITLQEFQNCFEQWEKRWDKFIDSQGEYFEGD